MQTLTTLFDWLLTASLRASALTVGVCFVQFLLQNHLSPRWRYCLWLPVLVVLLMPVLPQSHWSAESVFVWERPALEAPQASVVLDAALPALPVMTHRTPVQTTNTTDWSRVRVVTWAGVALLLLSTGGISLAQTLVRARRSRQKVSADLAALVDLAAREVGLLRKPCLLVSPQVSSPAVAGLLRPVLMLPPGFDLNFSTEEKRLILHHELMHLKRGDLPLNVLLCILLTLHWFNPLLWLAFLKARADREAACDAQVLKNAPQPIRSAYGHALLKIESGFAPLRQRPGFIGILERKGALRARIRSIAVPPHTGPLTGVFVATCIGAMTFFGVTRAEKPAPDDKKATLMGLVVRIIEFKRATDWDFGGRLPPRETAHEGGLSIQALRQKELEQFLGEALRQPAANLTAYPQIAVPAGEKGTIRSVVNHPIASDRKGKDGKPEVDYLPIGFTGSFVLKPLASGAVFLDIHLTSSCIVGEESVSGSPYPIINSQSFQAPVELATGMSAVVYGWHPVREKGKRPELRPILYVLTPGEVKTNEAFAAHQAANLRAAAPKKYRFNKALLGDVLRSLASDARLKLISLPEDHPASKKLVTFDSEASPFSVLETICKAYGLVLVLDSDICYVRAANDPELIGRTYPVPKSNRTLAEILPALQKIVKTPAAVRFDEKKRELYITATRQEHSWVDAWLRGLGREH